MSFNKISLFNSNSNHPKPLSVLIKPTSVIHEPTISNHPKPLSVFINPNFVKREPNVSKPESLPFEYASKKYEIPPTYLKQRIQPSTIPNYQQNIEYRNKNDNDEISSYYACIML